MALHGASRDQFNFPFSIGGPITTNPPCWWPRLLLPPPSSVQMIVITLRTPAHGGLVCLYLYGHKRRPTLPSPGHSTTPPTPRVKVSVRRVPSPPPCLFEMILHTFSVSRRPFQKFDTEDSNLLSESSEPLSLGRYLAATPRFIN